MEVAEGSKIAVWFSCGAASAVAAKLTLGKYGKANVSVLNCFVAEEDADNRRFLLDVQDWLGVPVTVLTSTDFTDGSCVSVWAKRKYMSNASGQAPCTYELKKRVRYAYQDANRVDFHVLGFTAEEESRYQNFILSECPNTLPILTEAGITKKDCYRIVTDAGIELPAIYLRGYPNANCIGCVKATSPTYWNHVRQADPAVFEARAAQSREIGARLVRVKGERIFLDELKLTDIGRPMKNMDFECGVFCTPENIVKEKQMEDMILSIHSLGETRVPPENATQEQIKVYLGDLLSLESKMTVAIRFEIGNTIEEMDPAFGDRKAFCQKYFGEHKGVEMMGYANVARQWDFNQSVGWSWSYYKEGMRLTRHDKEKMVKLFKQNRLKSVAQMKELIGELLGFKAIDNEDNDVQQIIHVDYPVQSDNNTIEAEYKPVAPALPPPPNDPDADYEDVERAHRLDNKLVEMGISGPQSVTGFKVEGQSVERVTYAPPTRLVEATRDTPAYLRQTPPEGLMDNGRQVIGAVCAIETDDPEIVYIRCVVPMGMTITEDQLLTVAIVRCQIP